MPRAAAEPLTAAVKVLPAVTFEQRWLADDLEVGASNSFRTREQGAGAHSWSFQAFHGSFQMLK